MLLQHLLKRSSYKLRPIITQHPLRFLNAHKQQHILNHSCYIFIRFIYKLTLMIPHYCHSHMSTSSHWKWNTIAISSNGSFTSSFKICGCAYIIWILPFWQSSCSHHIIHNLSQPQIKHSPLHALPQFPICPYLLCTINVIPITLTNEKTGTYRLPSFISQTK